MKRRTARALRPSRMLGSLTLLVALGLAVWLLTLVVSENAVNTPRAAAPSAAPKTTPPKTTPPTTIAPAKPKAKASPAGVTVPIGVYAGPASPAAAAVFRADAGAPVPYAFDYLDGSSWQSIANPLWFVQHWSGSGFRMIWGVPMLPTSGASLAAGAAGQYDSYFTELGFTLTNNGQANSVIVLGWDPEDPTLPWAVTTPAEAASYVSYFRQIVTAMRSVPNEQFVFAWDLAPGPSSVLPPALYPGNSFVDVIATDAFDKAPNPFGTSWTVLASSPYGPDWFANFAARHQRPLMIAKWGVVLKQDSGGGDSAAYVSQFLKWADRQHLFAAVTWDYGAWAITGGNFPRAASTLRTVAAAGAVGPIAKVVDA